MLCNKMADHAPAVSQLLLWTILLLDYSQVKNVGGLLFHLVHVTHDSGILSAARLT